MKKNIGKQNKTLKRCITLTDALNYQVCDTIVAANALNMYEKLKLRAKCRKYYNDNLPIVDGNNVNNNLVSFLTEQVNLYIQGVNSSQITKHGRCKAVDLELLQNIVHKSDGNNSTLKNITCKYNKKQNIVPISKSTISLRLRRRLNYSYRKIRLRNIKIKGQKYKYELLLYYLRYMDAVSNNDLLIWMDESSFNDRNTQVKSWQKKHCETHVHFDSGRVKSVSVMSAVTIKDCILSHYNTFSNDSNNFISFVKDLVQKLLNDISTNDLYNNGRCHLLLDNARIHRSDESIEYLKSTKLKVSFLPTYSPMLNNVELYWNKIKSHTRKYIYNDT